MLKQCLAALVLSLASLIWLSPALAETMDSFACLLAMHEKRVEHSAENSCRVAIVEEQDLMVYMIGQEYINLGQFDKAYAFYQSYLGSGYHEGAMIGKWTMDRFILGNRTDFEPNFKRDPFLKKLLREAASRGDTMAAYVLRGYTSRTMTRIKTMALDDGNLYASLHYIFFSEEPIKEKYDLIKAVYKTGSPMGKVVYSIYSAAVKDRDKQSDDLKEALELARSAHAQGSQCALLPLSIFYQLGKVVNKDVKEASKLFSLAKKECWYAEKNSDVAWR